MKHGWIIHSEGSASLHEHLDFKHATFQKFQNVQLNITSLDTSGAELTPTQNNSSEKTPAPSPEVALLLNVIHYSAEVAIKRQRVRETEIEPETERLRKTERERQTYRRTGQPGALYYIFYDLSQA